METGRNQIRYYREYHGISQRQLARMSGVTNGEISGIERGLHLPNVVTGIRIARALGTTVEKIWAVD